MSRKSVIELLVTAAVVVSVAYLQRKASSITFADTLTRWGTRHTIQHEPPLPRDFLRELYDETR